MMHTKYILKGKSALNRDKKKKHFVIPKICVLLHSLFYKSKNAQMAELVDALVSNTNIFGCAGSTPALGTQNKKAIDKDRFFVFILMQGIC